MLSDAFGKLIALRSENLRLAIEEARPLARQRTNDEAIEIVKDALRRHDVFASPGEVAIVAWQLAHPGRAMLQPFRSRREVKRALRQQDPDGTRFEAEAGRVSELCRAIPEVRATSGRRTIDGALHTVHLKPWTREGADRVRALLAPIEVKVVPADDPDDPPPTLRPGR